MVVFYFIKSTYIRNRMNRVEIADKIDMALGDIVRQTDPRNGQTRFGRVKRERTSRESPYVKNIEPRLNAVGTVMIAAHSKAKAV